jgi:hypothetical protein
MLQTLYKNGKLVAITSTNAISDAATKIAVELFFLYDIERDHNICTRCDFAYFWKILVF